MDSQELSDAHEKLDLIESLTKVCSTVENATFARIEGRILDYSHEYMTALRESKIHPTAPNKRAVKRTLDQLTGQLHICSCDIEEEYIKIAYSHLAKLYKYCPDLCGQYNRGMITARKFVECAMNFLSHGRYEDD